MDMSIPCAWLHGPCEFWHYCCQFIELSLQLFHNFHCVFTKVPDMVVVPTCKAPLGSVYNSLILSLSSAISNCWMCDSISAIHSLCLVIASLESIYNDTFSSDSYLFWSLSSYKVYQMHKHFILSSSMTSYKKSLYLKECYNKCQADACLGCVKRVWCKSRKYATFSFKLRSSPEVWFK